MQIDNLKNVVVGGWVMGVALVGYAVGVTSSAGWAAVAVVGCVPPLVLWRFYEAWGTGAESMSESIRKALRP